MGSFALTTKGLRKYLVTSAAALRNDASNDFSEAARIIREAPEDDKVGTEAQELAQYGLQKLAQADAFDVIADGLQDDG